MGTEIVVLEEQEGDGTISDECYGDMFFQTVIEVAQVLSAGMFRRYCRWVITFCYSKSDGRWLVLLDEYL
jgi:hypothetical protein